jgi:L-asparaginase
LHDDPASVPVVACGGSIEARLVGGIKEIAGDLRPLVRAAEALAARRVALHRFARRPSFAHSAADLVRLAAMVRTLGAGGRRPVVLCGTDALEEVAFALDLLAQPVGAVVTGAAGDASPGSDGVANLAGALQTAVDERLAGGSTYLAFAGAIRLGREVVETSGPPDLFAHSPGAPVAVLSDGRLRLERGRRWPVLPRPAGDPAEGSVLVVSCHLQADASQLDLGRPDVVIVHGYGAGNVPPSLAVALERRLRTGRAVVLCAAAPAIPVRAVSADPGGGERLLAAGAIAASGLTPRKAALLAGLCLRRGTLDAPVFSQVVDAVGAGA